ncbi:hypothetical protein LY71_102451 [Geodermatophilus tzadiensis]|uniref:Uncharacterized protein n=1 Tax=Geodermatophilus tzadiensis TaxID=1137988 RepID=A0A2T0U0E0_9ACTN|nr:hypothetical protein LY71_102451 [Geodermatophilus tzadiensis]
MTPRSHIPIPTPDPASYGHLVAAEDLVAGQYVHVHVRPLVRSGREWCQVTGSNGYRAICASDSPGRSGMTVGDLTSEQQAACGRSSTRCPVDVLEARVPPC